MTNAGPPPAPASPRCRRNPPSACSPLTGPTAANSSVRLLGARRSGDELLLDLEVLRSGDARGTTALPLTTHLDGTRTTENLTIPGQSLRFQKRIALPAGSDTGHGWLSIPADGNPRDNAAFFAYGPARPVKSLIVAPAGESADYLALAAAPPGFGNLSSPPRRSGRSRRCHHPGSHRHPLGRAAAHRSRCRSLAAIS